MTDQKERLKKLYALAMRGVGGEKETAQAILDKLLKKYAMTIDDLDEEVIQEYELEYHGKEQDRILMQTVYKVTDEKDTFNHLQYTHSGRACRTRLRVRCTAAQKAEIEFLFSFYKERKLIAEIADELNRTQDATRNRLYLLRGGGKPKGVTASVQLSAKEFDEMRAARTEVKQARKVAEQAKATERELAAFVAVGKRLLNARANKRVIAPVFEELQQLINTYENF